MRYQIITYSDDIGADEKLEYKTIGEAIKAAKEYLKEHEAVYIYDHVLNSVRHAFNTIPTYRIFSKNVSFNNCRCHINSKTFLY